MDSNIFYFDNSATTKPCECAVEAVVKSAEIFGNPSSLHRMGISAENILKEARHTVAQSLMCDDKNIYFTSGGTESNNTAVIGTAYRKKSIGKHIVTLKTEHPSVLNAFKFLENNGWDVTYLDVDRNGTVDISQLESVLTPHTVLVSMAHVNNEIGTVQPIEKVGQIVKKAAPRASFHVDCVQSYMKLPVNLKKANVSLASFSAHKIHGIKGCGALYVANGVNIDNINYGGGQESGLRSGTENIPGIYAFSEAVKWNKKIISDGGFERMKQMHDILYDAFEPFENIKLMCERTCSAPHIVSLSAKNVRGEVLLHALESKGFYVSTGSACSSHKRSMSHVLQAIGTSPDVAQGVIRISLSFENTCDEVLKLITQIKDTVNELEKYAQK